MKYLLTTAATLTASSALAHPGAHIHPHGADTWLVVALAALTVAGTMTFARAWVGKGLRK